MCIYVIYIDDIYRTNTMYTCVYIYTFYIIHVSVTYLCLYILYIMHTTYINFTERGSIILVQLSPPHLKQNRDTKREFQ